MVDIIIIRSNAIIYSPRVTKIGISLSKKYSVLILGWNREKVSKKLIRDHELNIKLLGMEAPLGRFSIISYLPFFWIWILANLIWSRPEIVHACDLDAVLPCFLYKFIFRKTLVFDVCDRYAMAHISPKHKLLYSIVNLLEEKSASNASVLITVADKLLATFRSKPKNSAVIMNCSDDILTSNEILTRESNDKIEKFRLIFPGTISRDRGLEILSQAVNGLDNVELLIAGRVIDKELLHRILKEPNVKYMGLLERVDALTLTSKSDVMVILYDPQVPNNNFSASNKLFEAMMFGLPIITNVSSDIVKAETDCGIVVNYCNVNQIRAAIVRLKEDAKLRKRLGNNAREAYLQKYNWSNVEKKLFDIYQGFLCPSKESN